MRTFQELLFKSFLGLIVKNEEFGKGRSWGGSEHHQLVLRYIVLLGMGTWYAGECEPPNEQP
jgi:hypothetical protein